MEELRDVQVALIPYTGLAARKNFDLDALIFDLNQQMELLRSQADQVDYLVAISSGLLCGALDLLWVGDFDLTQGRKIASEQVDSFVVKTAKLLGCKKDDLQSAVAFLQSRYPLASDGNTPQFGGGLQHHLRDFAHHPTFVGLVFSLLTQFTYKAYGTDPKGNFLVVDIPEHSRRFIGEDVPTKIFYGTFIWFFHLVSDMAGTDKTAGKSGGTGIPGPLLSLAKELSALPIFQSIKVGDCSLSEFLSKLFNGTLFMRRDEKGKIIKESVVRFDLRGELGVGMELGRQAIPVVANECIVRGFYLIRALGVELRRNQVRKIADLRKVEWSRIKPAGSPTVDRMLLVATGVFTAVDVGGAVLTQKYWVSINYVGVGRFAVAIGKDVSWCLKRRDLQRIKEMYETMGRYIYRKIDDNIYRRIGQDMEIDKLGLTAEQTELLYNLYYHKTLHDIEETGPLLNGDHIRALKRQWLEEWQAYLSDGFSSFIQIEDAELHWYTLPELLQKIRENEPMDIWLRLAMLEAMLFTPYYPLSLDKDKNGKDVPSRKYRELERFFNAHKSEAGDAYLDSIYTGITGQTGYIKRLRRCYNACSRELSEVLKTALTAVSAAAVVALAAVFAVGALAPAIAVALVGSNFAGLSGAALTGACLAYLGGGAVAAGGLGMAGGTAVIVGGGAVLGIGLGTGVGGAVGAAGLLGKKNTILQSAKLLVSVREIILNDEHDLAYSNTIYEKYVQNIVDIEKGLVELRVQADEANEEEKKKLKAQIKNAEETVKAMNLAKKSLRRYISSFAEGLEQK